MDTTQANKVIGSLYSDIRATCARIVGSHWRGVQNAATRDDAVDEVTQDAVVRLLSYSLPRYDESKRQRKGEGSLRTYVLSCAANHARNWRKAHANKAHDAVDTHCGGLTGEDESDDAARGFVVVDETPDAFATLTRAADMQAIEAAIAHLDERDRAVVAGLLAGTPKGDIARSLGRSPAWVTGRLKAIAARVDFG